MTDSRGTAAMTVNRAQETLAGNDGQTGGKRMSSRNREDRRFCEHHAVGSSSWSFCTWVLYKCLEDREDRNKEKSNKFHKKYNFFLNYCNKNSLRNKYHVNVKRLCFGKKTLTRAEKRRKCNYEKEQERSRIVFGYDDDNIADVSAGQRRRCFFGTSIRRTGRQWRNCQ